MSLRGAVPDYIYWMLFVVFTAVHYYTKTQGTAQEGLITFFIIVWLSSFLVLLALKVYAREGRSEIVDYDENLQRWHIDYIIAGLLGVELVAFFFSFLAGQVTASQVNAVRGTIVPFSAMWVPQMSVGLPHMSLRFYDDILFNFGLVATAEESSKILAIKAFNMKLGHTRNGRILSIFGPVAFWALLHGYNSYVGYGEAVMWLMITSAFISGLIMYYTVRETKNILVAFIIHGLHNALVVLSMLL